MSLLLILPLFLGVVPPTSVSLRVCDSIHLGMTLPQVTAAIGVPPGRYDGGTNADERHCRYAEYVRETGVPIKSPRMRKLAVASWVWSDYWVSVAFDGNGKAVGCYLLRPRFSYPLNDPAAWQ